MSLVPRWSLLLLGLIACGGGDDHPPGDDTPLVAPAGPLAVDTRCAPGAVKDCKVTIAQYDGLTACFTGTSTCKEDRSWGDCIHDDSKK